MQTKLNSPEAPPFFLSLLLPLVSAFSKHAAQNDNELSSMPAVDVCLVFGLTLWLCTCLLLRLTSCLGACLSFVTAVCLPGHNLVCLPLQTLRCRAVRCRRDLTRTLCSTSPSGWNPKPLRAHCVDCTVTQTNHKPAQKRFPTILVKFLGFSLLFLFKFFLICPSDLCSFFSSFFSLLVIYSGQSVPLLCLSLREDEQEWCCFIMFFSAMWEKDGEKERKGNLGQTKGFKTGPFKRGKKTTEKVASQEQVFNYSLLTTNLSGKREAAPPKCCNLNRISSW